MATVCISGANRGIGLALTELYLNKGYLVIALCRNKSSQLEKLQNENLTIIDQIDITNSQSIDKLKGQLNHCSIDILINNAGKWCNDSLDHFDLEQMLDNFKINTLGTLQLTYALLPILFNNNHQSKIAVITSKMGSITDNTSGGRYGYRMSKAALNAAMKSLSIDLKELSQSKNDAISVGLIHPGWVQTDMGGKNALITPKISAEGIYQVIENLNLDNSGEFFNYDGSLIPW